MQKVSISHGELEQCLKCSICTAVCPVMNNSATYPGPKQCGPDAERYRMKDIAYFDEASLKMCLNCKRCETACPHGVKIAELIQAARRDHSTHGPGLREMALANTDFMGSVATLVAPIANFGTGLGLTKWVLDKTIKIDHRRTFPKYAGTKFETWFRNNAEAQQSQYKHQVAYFHGCFVNYNFPQLGKDLVNVMNALGYGVQLLEKEKCCGVALMANGMYKQAKKQALVNAESMRKVLKQGVEGIVTTSSSCTLNMRDEYSSMLGIDQQDIRESIGLAVRFISRLAEDDRVKLVWRKDFKKHVAYHTACHMARLGWNVYTISLLRQIPGLQLDILEQNCCGISGTYGFKKENYDLSQRIGSTLFADIQQTGAEAVVTECETCKWQIEMSTPLPVLNPISLLAEALDLEATRQANA